MPPTDLRRGARAPWPTAAGSGSGSGSAGRAPCCARSAIRSWPSAARSSPGPTARAASSRWPGPRCGPPATASARRPSRTSSRYRERIVVDGRPIDAADFARLVEATVLAVADRVAPPARRPPTEFELLTAVVFRHFAEARARRRARRGRAGRAARRDACLGRRRGRRHQRRPRPHGPARPDRRARSPARRRRSSSAATSR